ncbi:MAG TPA: hypothetical protein PKW95_21095 [bacterium]|nr:hypothetical protein [bacterium]
MGRFAEVAKQSIGKTCTKDDLIALLKQWDAAHAAIIQEAAALPDFASMTVKDLQNECLETIQREFMEMVEDRFRYMIDFVYDGARFDKGLDPYVPAGVWVVTPTGFDFGYLPGFEEREDEVNWMLNDWIEQNVTPWRN